MLLTESEARNKICPLTRNDPEYDDRECIASVCMAWRWHYGAEGTIKTDRGYCGYVGKSE